MSAHLRRTRRDTYSPKTYEKVWLSAFKSAILNNRFELAFDDSGTSPCQVRLLTDEEVREEERKDQ